MTKALVQTYNIANENRTRLASIMMAICAFAILLYAMNVFRIVSTTVALQKVEAEINTVSTVVDSLDGQYLQLSSTITPDQLSAYNMKQGKVSQYISRTGNAERVAMATHEL